MFLNLRPRPVYAVAGLLLLLLLVALLVIKLCSPTGWGHNEFIMLGILIFLLANFFVYLPWKVTKNFKQNPFFKHKMTRRIDDIGLHTESDLGNVTLPWDHLRKWKQNSRMILLYTSGSTYMVFPKRLFDEDAWKEFEELLVKHLKKLH